MLAILYFSSSPFYVKLQVFLNGFADFHFIRTATFKCLIKLSFVKYNCDTLDWKAKCNVSKTLRSSGTPCSKEHLDDLNIVDINELCV